MDKDCDDSGNSDSNDILPYFETPKIPRGRILRRLGDMVVGTIVFLALVERPGFAISVLLGLLIWEIFR